MSSRSEHGYAEAEACFDIAGARTTCNVSGAPCKNTGFGSVRATAAELDYRSAPRGGDNASRLGCDHRLVSEHSQQKGLRNLRLDDGRANDRDRLSWKKRRSFAHREQIAGEAK